MTSVRRSRRLLPGILLALLLPSAAQAQQCGSVGKFASEVWDKYVEEAREAGCLSPVRGPRKYAACAVRSYANTLHIFDRMVGWWNSMANGSWATVGPRRLDPGWQEGTLRGTSGRLWMGTAPVNTGSVRIDVEKRDGVVPAEVVVCASADDGSTREIGRYRFGQGRDNIGRESVFLFTDLEADLLSVRIDGKGEIPTNEFNYRIRLRTTPRQHDLGPVPGFADLHVHQAAQLGFGGNQLWGSHIGPPEEALAQCGPATVGGEIARSLPLPHVSTLHGLMPFNASVGEGEARHGSGAPGFGDWPHFNDVLHQQVHEDWLKSAHERGLNLVVASAVNFEPLCYILKVLYPEAGDRNTCRDMESVERQIEAFIDMDERRDWYEIAMDPWHARQIIHDGNLAVVISMEVSHLFPYDAGPPRTQLDRLHAMGLRTLQLAHETNSRYAGAAPHRNLFEAFEALKWPTTDPGRLFAGARGEALDAFGFDYDEDGKNAAGLTGVGRNLVGAMIDRHMLIDVAHLSERSVRDVYELVANEHDYYPLYNSHTRFEPLLTVDDRKVQQEFLTTDEQLGYIRETGGMIGLRTGQNTILGYQEDGPGAVSNTCFGSSRSFAQLVHYGRDAGVRMGFGSDLNGFINQLGPRFGPEGCPAGDERREAQLAAQLEGPRSPCRESSEGSGGRDFDTEGLRHVGYLPDLLADLRDLGTPGVDVLESSAEAFLRMWERAWSDDRGKVGASTNLAAEDAAVVAAETPWSPCGDVVGGEIAGLQGDWLRVDGNNPPNNGMRLRIEGDEGQLTFMPPGGIGGFRAGQILWQEIAADGTLLVQGSDGNFYDSELTWEGPDRFHIDVDRAASPGNDQTWERAGPSIDGEWVLSAPGAPGDGLKIRVEGDAAVVAYLPRTAPRWLRTGVTVWRAIRAGGLEEQVSAGRWSAAKIAAVESERLVVELGKGVMQVWLRPGESAGPPRRK